MSVTLRKAVLCAEDSSDRRSDFNSRTEFMQTGLSSALHFIKLLWTAKGISNVGQKNWKRRSCTESVTSCQQESLIPNKHSCINNFLTLILYTTFTKNARKLKTKTAQRKRWCFPHFFTSPSETVKPAVTHFWAETSCCYILKDVARSRSHRRRGWAPGVVGFCDSARSCCLMHMVNFVMENELVCACDEAAPLLRAVVPDCYSVSAWPCYTGEQSMSQLIYCTLQTNKDR